MTVAKQRHSLAAAAVAIAACAGGCATIPLSAETPAGVKQEAVSARAKARWDALIKLDLEQAYAYLSPASRTAMPLDLYRAKHKLGLYRAAKVDDVKCERDVCTVKLSLTYDYKRFKGVTTPITEKWIITQGQAWFVYQG